MPDPIRVLLIDDHVVVRVGYRRLLEAQPDIRVAGEAATAREALDWLRQQEAAATEPELVILDLGLPDLGGVELIRRLLQRQPRLRILVFTMHREPIFATQALRAGALGYVTKSSPPEVLIDAVYRVAARIRNPAPAAGRQQPRGNRRATVDQRQDRAELPLPDQDQTRRPQRHRTDAHRPARRADLMPDHADHT